MATPMTREKMMKKAVIPFLQMSTIRRFMTAASWFSCMNCIRARMVL
ncbi:unknown [Akkermansia muciniphila CAG:154]|nr:unknown [Akkermansia muciniphila CAG:154]